MRYGKGKSEMGVAQLLGIVDEDSDLLQVAARRWSDWATKDDRLRAVSGVRDLRSWLRKASTTDADRVLHALAKRASVHGGDDRVAASTLAFALLPGACTMACRLSTLAPRIDEIIAAQLWIEIRSFPWQRLTKVASNILMNTRAEVLRECGAASQVQKRDPTWYRTLPIDPDDSFWRGPRVATSTEPLPTAAEELLELLAWACENKVITPRDRSLLLSLAEAADRAEIRRSHGRAGLLSEEIAEVVGREYGLAAVTVRRRAGRSLRALSEACVGREISA
jgi:hypothetical protein